MLTTYPIYILDLHDNTRIVFPEDKNDIPHSALWEETVVEIVATHFVYSTRTAEQPRLLPTSGENHIAWNRVLWRAADEGTAQVDRKVCWRDTSDLGLRRT